MNDLISLEKIAQWQKLKTLVLDSVSSPITKRVYNMALDEFMGWFQQAPRSGSPSDPAERIRRPEFYLRNPYTPQSFSLGERFERSDSDSRVECRQPKMALLKPEEPARIVPKRREK